MTKKEFLKGMTYLGVAYSKEVSEKQIELWYEFFENYKYDDFRSAVKRIVQRQNFFPTIADLKKELTKITNPMLQLNAEEEFEKVRKAIRRYGHYRLEKLMNSLEPYTAEITRRIGINRICEAEEIQWIKREFISEFNNGLNRYEDILKQSEYMLTDREKETRARILSVANENLKRLENNES